MDEPGRVYDEMRRAYGFSGGVRGKYAERYASGANIVLLDPDVAEVFRDPASPSAQETNDDPMSRCQAEAHAAEASLLSRRGDVREAAELYRGHAGGERLGAGASLTPEERTCL